MSAPGNKSENSPRQKLIRLFVVLALLTAIVVFAWPHAAAWVNLQRGKSALEDNPVAARESLSRCLATWPNDAEAHFYASRAARRCEELGEAERHLNDAARLGWSPPLVDQERAQIQAEYQSLADLTNSLIADFRWPEADGVVNRWLEFQPESATAWALQGQIRERLRKVPAAIVSLREAVRLAPNNRRIAFDLARLLLENRQAPEEAAGVLERLVRDDPREAAAHVQLAACREAQGRPDEAATILDGVLSANPADPKAQFFRGRLELNRGNPKTAIGYLQRAAELDASDRETLYSIVVALGSIGTPEEVRVAEERWKRCDADLKRVAELATLIARSPENADLRSEIGELFLRNGRDADGVRWLQSALAKQPEHEPTHHALAEYYRRTGQTQLAAEHLRHIKPSSPEKK